MRQGQLPVAVPGKASFRYPALSCKAAALVQLRGHASIRCPTCVVQVEQKGKVVIAAEAKGPIRLRLCKEGSSEQSH